MVNGSKILTVSYGTFSCTLEGFDDPFSTMRSIAEYFRDLAADDRYFGAEPPTPDAEMLHRIAERENKRKVEARIEDNSVVLRQADTEIPEGKATQVAGEALLLSPEIKSPVAEAAPVAEVTPAVEAPTETAQAPQVASAEQPAQPVSPPAADFSDTSIAAKLRRIRSVVDNRDEDKSREDSENGLADDFYAEALAAMHDEEIGDQFEADEPAKSEPAEFLDTTEEDFVEEFEDEFDDEDEFETDEDETPAFAMAEETRSLEVETPEDEQDPATDTASDYQEDDTTSDIRQTGEGKAEVEFDADEAEAETDIYEELEEEFEEDDEDDEEFEDENVFSEQKAPEPMAIARVIKVRRNQAKEPVARQVKVAQEAPLEDMGEGDTMLSPEDEAALMAELAEVERDAEDDKAAGPGAKTGSIRRPVADAEDSSIQNRTAFDDGDFAGTDALDRIMAEANTKLESDEANQKRASIAHLRAAVQAKRADVEQWDQIENEDTSEEYRDDLARVVRPRRVRTASPKDARRLAPLVLVTEQRVDTSTDDSAQVESEATDASPRRVSKASGKDGSGAKAAGQDLIGDFTAFAAEAGAKGTTELLEAAAAFRTYVIGQDTFSRPQVMNLILKANPTGNLTREEGLRAFGKLIREGGITKIQRGRYSISESSRFRPGQKRASA